MSRNRYIYIVIFLIAGFWLIYPRFTVDVTNDSQLINKPTGSGSAAQPKNIAGNSFPTSSFFGFNNYTGYIPGHLPLIISVAHGGHIFPKDVPTREKNSPNVIISNDINTLEIGKALVKGMVTKFGGRRPYLVFNNLGRSKVDVNRPFEEGTEPNRTAPNEMSVSQQVWQDYHNFLKRAVEEVKENYGRGLVIDLHGTFIASLSPTY